MQQMKLNKRLMQLEIAQLAWMLSLGLHTDPVQWLDVSYEKGSHLSQLCQGPHGLPWVSDEKLMEWQITHQSRPTPQSCWNWMLVFLSYHLVINKRHGSKHGHPTHSIAQCIVRVKVSKISHSSYGFKCTALVLKVCSCFQEVMRKLLLCTRASQFFYYPNGKLKPGFVALGIYSQSLPPDSSRGHCYYPSHGWCDMELKCGGGDDMDGAGHSVGLSVFMIQ